MAKNYRRVTIMLDEDILKKLRIVQAKEIRKSENTVSLSRVINEILEKGVGHL